MHFSAHALTFIIITQSIFISSLNDGNRWNLLYAPELRIILDCLFNSPAKVCKRLIIWLLEWTAVCWDEHWIKRNTLYTLEPEITGTAIKQIPYTLAFCHNL